LGSFLPGSGSFPVRSLVSVERLRDRPYRSITTTIVFNWLLATTWVVDVVVCSAGNCARARVWIERRVPPSPSVANHRVLRQTYASVACYRRIDVVDGSIQGLNCNPSTPPDGGSHHLYCLGKNAPNLASCSFDKRGLILIIFGRQRLHTFENDVLIQLSLSLYFYFYKLLTNIVRQLQADCAHYLFPLVQ